MVNKRFNLEIDMFFSLNHDLNNNPSSYISSYNSYIEGFTAHIQEST